MIDGSSDDDDDDGGGGGSSMFGAVTIVDQVVDDRGRRWLAF